MTDLWFKAAQSGDTDKLQEILTAGEATIGETDANGRTAIFYSQMRGHLDACVFLASHGEVPMDPSNLFEGPGGRLNFWQERMRQRPRAPALHWSEQAKQMTNWTVRRAPEPVPAGPEPAPRKVRVRLGHKKDAVAERQRTRQLAYHSHTTRAGKAHPFYTPRVWGVSRSRRGRCKPTLGDIEEDYSDYAISDDDDDENVAPECAPTPISLAEVIAAVAAARAAAAAAEEESDAESFDLVSIASDAASWIEVEPEDSGRWYRKEG